MNILVIGCDQVGASLIRDLERIGHDISLIERDPEQRKRAGGSGNPSFGGAKSSFGGRGGAYSAPLWATPPTRTSCGKAAWRTATPWPPSAETTPST